MRKSNVLLEESILSTEEVKRLKSSKEQVSRYAESQDGSRYGGKE